MPQIATSGSRASMLLTVDLRDDDSLPAHPVTG